MTEYYEKRKQSIYKWRQNNREKLNKISAAAMKRKYKSKLYYSYDHVCRLFRNIHI